MPHAISVKRLSKHYDIWKKPPGMFGTLRGLLHRGHERITAVNKLSFSIEEGACIGFIGPNGAGKTTTLKMLSGILWPSSGEVRVLGHLPWNRERSFQRQIAIVMGQKNQLWWDLPAEDTFLLNKEIYGIGRSDYASRVSELASALNVGTLLRIPVRKLSLGERMKCELINALLHQPRVLLLDEPTIGLDVTAQKAVRDFLREWNEREGATVLLTSHAIRDIEELCERVLVIDHGSLRYDGTLSNLAKKTGSAKNITITLEKPISPHRAEKFGTVVEFEDQRVRYQVQSESVQTLAARLLQELPITDILIEETPIEDVIRQVFSSTSSEEP